MRIICGILLILLAKSSLGNDDEVMRIGIFRDVNLRQIRLQSAVSGYQIIGDTVVLGEMYAPSQCLISYSQGKCSVTLGGISKGTFDTVRVVQKANEAEFKIKPISPSSFKGGFFLSKTETLNISPAPSASDPVIIGVCIIKKPLSLKY